MTPDITVSPASALTPPPGQQSGQTAPKESKSSLENPPSSSEAAPSDTVTLSKLVQQALTEARAKDEKKQETDPLNSKKPSTRSAAKIEFAYDARGELITRYLDTADRLVYQVPSELMMHMRETEQKPKTAVNTTV